MALLAIFDRAVASAGEIVDMPDRCSPSSVRLVLQNAGHLAARKRGQFEKPSDDEVEAMEAAVRAARGSVPVQPRLDP